ncbi:MAG: glycosyltransferase family 39 protein [Geminicoccaceae bacterium]
MNNPPPADATGPRTGLVIGGLVLLALAVRIAGLPLAAHDSIDHALRVWIAWRWSEQPFLLTQGVWPPLHMMLMGLLLRLGADPATVPTWLHVGLGSLLPPAVYLLARQVFSSSRGAIAAGVACALYPVAILNSLSVRSETPFALLLVLSLLAVAKARGTGSLGWALAGGLALTVAAGFRYEAWMLLPLVAVLLWPHRRAIAAFVGAGLVVPAISMVSNAVVLGEPLLGFTWAAEHELEKMGKADLPLAAKLGQLVDFTARLAGGLTPLLVLGIAAGVLLLLARRDRRLLWLVPPLGLYLLLSAGALRGALVPKVNYTETLGVLLLPFLAAFLGDPALDRRLRLRVALQAALFASMTALLVVGTLRDVPGMRERSRLVATIPAISPVPILAERAALDHLAGLIAAEPAGSGLILDFFGFADSGYLALNTRLHRDAIYAAPGAPNARLQPRTAGGRLDHRDFPLSGNWPARLDDFVARYPRGLLLVLEGSRFQAWLETPDAGLPPLQMEMVEGVPWPLPGDPKLLAPGASPGSPSRLLLLRYSAPPER